MRTWQRDLPLAVVLAVASQVEIARATDLDEPILAAAAALACTLALVARRRWPLPVAAGIGAVLMVASPLGAPPESIGVLLAVIVAVYSVAAEEPLRRALTGAVVVTAGICVSIVLDRTDTAWNVPPSLTLFVAAPWMRERTRRSAANALRTEPPGSPGSSTVAHGVSVIALQADAATAALESDPDRAYTPLRPIAATARDSRAELRRLLEILREPDEEDPLAPTPESPGCLSLWHGSSTPASA